MGGVYLAGQLLLLFARCPVVMFWHLLLAGMIVTNSRQARSGKVTTIISIVSSRPSANRPLTSCTRAVVQSGCIHSNKIIPAENEAGPP